MSACRKCGGSGDIFVTKHKSTGAERIGKWTKIKAREWQVVGIIECSLCHGYGVEENV